MRNSEIANETFCISFLFRYVKKCSFFAAFNFKGLMKQRKKRFKKVSWRENRILHAQKYKLVDFLYAYIQIPVNTHATIRSCRLEALIQQCEKEINENNAKQFQF